MYNSELSSTVIDNVNHFCNQILGFEFNINIWHLQILIHDFDHVSEQLQVTAIYNYFTATIFSCPSDLYTIFPTVYIPINKP